MNLYPKQRQAWTLAVLCALLVAVVVAVMVFGFDQVPVLATDPSPQTVTQSRTFQEDAGTVRYADKAWSIQEAGYYGIADIYYTVDISDTTEVVTVTLRHSPACELGLWAAHSTISYTYATEVYTIPVFSRVTNYGGCLGVFIEQSDSTATSPVTTTLDVVLKNN